MKSFWYRLENDEDRAVWNKKFGSTAFVEIETEDSYTNHSRHLEKIQAGEWWSDKIKKLIDEPSKKLQLALESLPYPAAFKECTIVLRALIREKRKQNQEFSVELKMLYQIAAMESLSIPYSKVLKEPGFNVMESIPGGLLFNMPVYYSELGYTKLKLLNKTDVKWIVEEWGEPIKHTTLHKKHNNIWVYYENKLKMERRKVRFL